MKVKNATKEDVAAGTVNNPLSSDLLQRINAYWRAANYLSVGQIYLFDNPLDVAAILKLSHATYSKMVQNLIWATGYNTFAIPLAAGVLYSFGILLTPAMGAVLMSASTVIVAINARLLNIKR